MSISPWSFSKIKAFEQCPKKFYHLKVAKDYSEPETEAMFYGTAFHEAAEEYVRNNVPLPPQFEYAKGGLDALIAKRGDKLCEYKMGLTASLEPCDFFADDVWFRGIADLVILDELTYALRYGWLDTEAVIADLAARPAMQHVVVTGRAAPAELIEAADTVSTIGDTKHAYRAGVKAQPGIDL